MMADTSSPYGLRPVKRVDGLPWTNSIETYLINPAGHTGNIFNGQVVALDTNGYIVVMPSLGSAADQFDAGTIGVFVGCEYVNSEGRVVHSQYYPSGTTGVVKAKVVSDPNVMFQAQCDGSATQAALGANIHFTAVQIDGSNVSDGSTFTGNSASKLDISEAASTATFGFRIVGFVDSVDSSVGDNFTDVLVKFNQGYHSYTSATGV